MRGLRADIVHAIRLYARTPAASAIAVLVLAAAMAALTALFSLWSNLALTPRNGFEDSGSLITVGWNDGERFFGVSAELIDRVNDEAASIDAMAGIFGTRLDVERDGEFQPVDAELVTSAYFSGLRPRLQLGRGFEQADHDADATGVVVLSDALWHELYTARRDVIGETLLARSQPLFRTPDTPAEQPAREYRIVGVLAPEMTGTFKDDTGLWLPLEQANPFVGAGADARRFPFLGGLARLARGARAAAARTELDGRFGETGEGAMISTAGSRLDAIEGVVRDLNAQRNALRQLQLFLAGGVLLALVAACNVSLFLLSRAPGRRRELSIRMAVGAPLRRLARQLVTESSLLVAAAAALGLLASLWLVVLLKSVSFLRTAQWHDVAPIDARMLAVVAVSFAVLTLLVSLAPVLGLRRLQIAAATRSVSARAGWGQRLAGTAQLTAAAVLGAAALAFVWYLQDVASADRGFSPQNLIAVQFEPPDASRSGLSDPDTALREHERVRDVIGALPGVEAVAFGTRVPGVGGLTAIVPVAPPDEPEKTFNVDSNSADPAYFELLGARLLRGRFLEETGRDEAVINETFARRLWGTTDVIGEKIPRGNQPTQGGPPPLEVVGVIEDIVVRHPADEMRPMVFRTFRGSIGFELVLIESPSSVADIRRELQRKIDSGELERPIENIQSIEDGWANVLAPDRARTLLAVAAAVLVVVLAAFGYYGTQRFLVAAGRREYAILAALGAGPRALGRVVLTRGLVQGVPGLVLGSVLAYIVVAWMHDDFVSDAVSSGVVTALTAVGVAVLVLLATLGPAREARRTESAPLLKEE